MARDSSNSLDPPTQTKRFRFKAAKRSRSPSSSTNSQQAKRHRHSHRDHSHYRKRSPDPETPPLSPDTAFRESLFDALADDEGADYWASVYDQPIHTYSRYYVPKQDSGGPSVDEDGNPILERMDDEQYAAYVRRRMWEKSRGFVEEERQRRTQAREGARIESAEAQRQKAERGERMNFWQCLRDCKSSESSRAQNQEAAWKERWRVYQRAWEKMGTIPAIENATQPAQEEMLQEKAAVRLPWPTKSGRARDITQESVETFFRHGAELIATPQGDTPSLNALRSLLKLERVRWHPDKIHQRFGFLGVDESTLRYVTAIFQIVDALWVKIKASEKNPGLGTLTFS